MSPDQNRLQSLLDRLRRLELRLPQPHERPIVEVARLALENEIRLLSQAMRGREYWRPRRGRSESVWLDGVRRADAG